MRQAIVGCSLGLALVLAAVAAVADADAPAPPAPVPAPVPAPAPAPSPAPLPAMGAADRVRLTLDASEAEAVLSILDGRDDDASWQRLFGAEPYTRLKQREAAIAKQFHAPERVFTDEDFRKFVRSPDLAKRRDALRQTLERWRRADLRAAAGRVLAYLPAGAIIRAKVYPVIKPQTNSFVWDLSGDPAIFLYLDPDTSAAKFENIVAHELHHIGFASVADGYDALIAGLPERARAAAGLMGAFGEGVAMLAAAGGPDADVRAGSTDDERARWNADMANVDRDLRTLDAFFLDILSGRLAGDDAIGQKASTFFGVQGPWYTVGYRMAVTVEKRFGRARLIDAMIDRRLLLSLYNQAAKERNAAAPAAAASSPAAWSLWSDDLLSQVGAPAI